MLKNIVINPDTNIISVSDPKALVSEAEARTHKRGPKTYMENFIAGKTRLRRRAGWYPEEKKVEVAALFAAGVVSSRDLERLTGINENTIRAWRTSEWWPEMLERIHAQHDEETVSKFTNIVDKSLEIVQDRLINGDFGYNKETGELYRKPVSLRDATVAGAIIVDKRQLLRGKPTSRSESIGVDQRLAKLAEEFKKFSKAKDVTHESQAIIEETVEEKPS